MRFCHSLALALTLYQSLGLDVLEGTNKIALVEWRLKVIYAKIDRPDNRLVRVWPGANLMLNISF